MNKAEYEQLYNRLDEYVKENVDEKRYIHIQGVVKAAEKYAIKYGADVEKARIAAIFHDACKNQTGALEHGKAAARLIQEQFGVTDDEIIQAIANHTIGRKDNYLLEKVIKLADLLEEGRSYDDVPRIRRDEEKSNNIDETYLTLLERQKAALIRKGIDYDKTTDVLIDYWKGKLGK